MNDKAETEAAAATHAEELQKLGRSAVKAGIGTPWGLAQTADRYGEGIIYYSTSSHGGFRVDDDRNRVLHPLYRNADGWYEEDCEWAKIAHAFPDLLTAFERLTADRTLKNVAPDAYEAINGVVLPEGASYKKDRRIFEERHRNDWLVISALNAAFAPGMVECIASTGGNRDGRGEQRFLMPAAENDTRSYLFVIDPARHRLYEGPSGFVTWRSPS